MLECCRLELDNLASFLKGAVAYKNKIGFKGELLLEPKPQVPPALAVLGCTGKPVSLYAPPDQSLQHEADQHLHAFTSKLLAQLARGQSLAPLQAAQ